MKSMLGCLWACILFLAAVHGLRSVEPLAPHSVHRSLYDRSHIGKRHNRWGDFQLKNHSQFLWLSPNTSNSNMGVSLDIFTKADEYVLDLFQFQDELENFACGEPMQLHFKSNYSYSLAVDAWSWVKGNNSRAFILVEDHPACDTVKDAGNRRPWIVTDLEDLGNTTIKLLARNSSWKDVLHQYDIRFGNIHHPARRQSNWDQTFSLPLTYPLPQSLWRYNVDKNSVGINCNDCQTKGSFNLEGSISGAVNTGITKFQLKAWPRGIEMDVNLSLDIVGDLSVLGLSGYNQEWLIGIVPIPELPNINIPYLLDIGPNVTINAGIVMDSIKGEGTITQPIRVTIPDSSFATVDLKSTNHFNMRGWVPDFHFDPIISTAKINTTVQIYLELVVALDFEVVNDGFQYDVAFRAPDVTMKAALMSNPKGACPQSSAPLGLEVDSSVGGMILLEGYEKVEGQRKKIMNQTLWSNPDVIVLAPACLPL